MKEVTEVQKNKKSILFSPAKEKPTVKMVMSNMYKLIGLSKPAMLLLIYFIKKMQYHYDFSSNSVVELTARTKREIKETIADSNQDAEVLFKSAIDELLNTDFVVELDEDVYEIAPELCYKGEFIPNGDRHLI